MSVFSRVALVTACGCALFAPSPAAADRRAPAASPEPRLYSGVVARGRDFARIFQVRPPAVDVSCADGGTLELVWRRWTPRSGSALGWTRPCDGLGQRIVVSVSRPIEGYFTRMSVRYEGGGPTPLGLGHLGGRLAWVAVSRLAGPGRGVPPWPR